MDRGSFPSYSSETAANRMYQVMVNSSEYVRSDNRDVTTSINSQLTGSPIDGSRNCQAVSSAVNRSRLEDVKFIHYGGCRCPSRALPRKPGYCPFPRRDTVSPPPPCCFFCSRGHSRLRWLFSPHSQQVKAFPLPGFLLNGSELASP